MINKKISVLMSYFNAEKYLEKSIKSILEQSYSYIELITLNDGSTDNSHNIINKFSDKRLVKLSNSKNMGVPYSFNKMINASKGEFIAFMDADDISLKNRLEEQINFLEKNKYDMCGTSAIQFGNKRLKELTIFEDFNDIKTLMIIGNPIINSTVMIKTNVLKKFTCNTSMISWDYDLHSNIILNNYSVYNINKVLLKSRSHNFQDSLINYNRGIVDSYNISKKYFLAQKDLLRFKKYLDCTDYGYSNNIRFKNYIKSILAFKKILQIRNNDKKILNIFNTELIQKIYPIDIFVFIKLLKIFKKLNIVLDKKHIFLLFVRSLFLIKSNNRLVTNLINLYYFIKKL